MTHSRITRILFQDNTGKYAIAQPPNMPVYIIIISYLVTKIVGSGPVNQLFEAINAGAVFLWAYLEIVYGESVLRRILGVIVMILFLTSKL